MSGITSWVLQTKAVSKCYIEPNISFCLINKIYQTVQDYIINNEFVWIVIWCIDKIIEVKNKVAIIELIIKVLKSIELNNILKIISNSWYSN